MPGSSCPAAPEREHSPFAQSIFERGPGQPEQARRRGDVAVGAVQRVATQLLLDLEQRRARCRRWRRSPWLGAIRVGLVETAVCAQRPARDRRMLAAAEQVTDVNEPAVLRDDHAALDEVLQLADVAWIVV